MRVGSVRITGPTLIYGGDVLGVPVIDPVVDFTRLCNDVRALLDVRYDSIADLSRQSMIPHSALCKFLGNTMNLGCDNSIKLMLWLGKYDVRQYVLEGVKKNDDGTVSIK